MQLVLRASAAMIRATFTGPDGEATEPDTPTVTITRDSDGVEVVTDGAATADGGTASYTLDPSDAPTVDLLRASWSATDASAADTEIGVVGGFLCSLEAIAGALTGSTFDAAALRAKREEAERKLEDECHVAFRPSYKRETLVGDGTATLLLSQPRPRSILAATVDGVDVLADLEILGGRVIRPTAFSCGSELDIAYEHGWPGPPEPITRAAIRLAAAYFESGDDRISRFREDDQEFFLSVAGTNRPTGIPEVDRAIVDYGYPVLGR